MNKIQLKELDTHAAFKIDFLYVGKTRVGSSRSLIIIIFWQCKFIWAKTPTLSANILIFRVDEKNLLLELSLMEPQRTLICKSYTLN